MKTQQQHAGTLKRRHAFSLIVFYMLSELVVAEDRLQVLQMPRWPTQSQTHMILRMLLVQQDIVYSQLNYSYDRAFQCISVWLALWWNLLFSYEELTQVISPTPHDTGLIYPCSVVPDGLITTVYMGINEGRSRNSDRQCNEHRIGLVDDPFQLSIEKCLNQPIRIKKNRKFQEARCYGLVRFIPCHQRRN